jgi:hypothetical protein
MFKGRPLSVGELETIYLNWYYFYSKSYLLLNWLSDPDPEAPTPVTPVDEVELEF